MKIDHVRARSRLVAGVAVAGLLLAGCDFKVTNPGPVQDEFLDDPAAHAAIVRGMNRAFNDAWNEIARRGGSSARELFPSGNTGRIGIGAAERRGDYRVEVSGWWNLAGNARWVADDGLRRFREVLEGDTASSAAFAQASLWGGYSYRLSGEHFCQAVIDGGELQSHEAFFEGAEEHFTRAIDIATDLGDQDLVNAARAGRASVRAQLGDWTGAVADAEQIPTDFVFETPFAEVEEGQFNWMYWATAASPYRVFTPWNTFYEDYYKNTGDPRTPWREHPDFQFGSQPVGDFDEVPWFQQRKYTERSAPVRLASGREMRLIEAEALLRDGQWQSAMDKINSLRQGLESDHTGDPIPQWTASSAQEAWTFLKRERGIELWLEGRRLADLRRWVEEQAPGEFHPLEMPPTAVYLAEDRDLCFPVPLSERETNPNVPLP